MYRSIQAGSAKSGILVVAVHQGSERLPRGTHLDAAAREAVEHALGAPEFKGESGQMRFAGDDLLVIGLGPKAKLDGDTVRSVGAKLVRRLSGMEAESALLANPVAMTARRLDSKEAGRCLAEGAGLANWRVDDYRGTAAKAHAVLPRLSLNAADAAFRKGLSHGLTLAECTNEARRLAATPPNICNPDWLSKETRRLARNAGLRCQVISAARAQEMGMGGLVNVGRASKHPPCLITLEHTPSRVAAAARGETLVLVGKTITYDTGGYSLKINNTMKGMKYDKCGGMAVIGAMLAIAALKVPVHVIGVLPTAENMVGGDAYRPDDIITMLNGVTVEVTNTDAEGRLVLADALAYACSKLDATAIVDVATLTGGVVVALGSWSAGLWCNDGSLQRRVERAAEASGERVWHLPLWEEHRAFMRSRHADIWNSAPKREGHAIQGAAFLSYFVDESIPWAHIDIAGVSDVDSDRPMHVTGPTGYGVRLLTDLATSFTR